MNYNLLFEKAKAKGVEDVEIYLSKSKSTSISVFKQDVDAMSIEDNEVISVRGIFKDKMGYAYTEKLNEDQFDHLLDTIIANAKVIESNDEEIIFEGSKKYEELNHTCNNIDEIQNSDIISSLKKLVKDIMNFDQKIDSGSAKLVKRNSKVKIINSKGIDLENENSYFYIMSSALAIDGKSRGNHYEILGYNDYKEFDFDSIAALTAKLALSKLNSDQIASGEYKTILDSRAASSLFSTMIGSFFADTVQKGMSSLKDKLNTSIAGKNVTIVDDPFFDKAIEVSSFDDEGVATKYKELVKDGILKTFLHNLKTAKKDNVESTGNGFKASAADTVNIKTTNAYLKPGNKSLEELISSVDKGVYITSLEGTHSGTNGITGDFSLQASGHLIENGKRVQAINLITVSGNFFEILNSIEEIGNEIGFGIHNLISPSLMSPPLLLDKLVISGK